MNFKRFLAVFKARNLEFWRDRSSLAWNLIFPVLLVVGFALVFSNDPKAEYKIGVLQATSVLNSSEHPVLSTQYIDFIALTNTDSALEKLRHHQLDLVIDLKQNQYWQNDRSAKGYLVAKIVVPQLENPTRSAVSGESIRYVDWALPGILGMNMMFSCLFGVGYVLVRYRKSSVLKRLQATPLSAFEFVSAQVVSRLLIVLVIASGIYVACDAVFDFMMLGSYWHLLLVTILGASAMISLGLLIASRSRSEELTGGLLNMASWPMMILSGVWFSLDGAPQALQYAAEVLPLTHLVAGARAVMIDGADLMAIRHHLVALAIMTLVFLTLGAKLFRWQGDGR